MIGAYLRLIRLHNCLLGCMLVLAGGLICAGSSALGSPGIWMAALSASMIMAAGNSLNDYYDWVLDSRAHPHRPIPQGQIPREHALGLSLNLFGISLIPALLTGRALVGIACLGILGLIIYNSWFSRTPYGNLAIAGLIAMLPVFGALSISGCQLSRLIPVLPGILLISYSRELIKDLQDYPSETQLRCTLPARLGIPKSKWISAGCLIAGIGSGLVPDLLGILDWIYLGCLSCSAPILILALTSLSRDEFECCSRLIKLGSGIILAGIMLDRIWLG